MEFDADMGKRKRKGGRNLVFGSFGEKEEMMHRNIYLEGRYREGRSMHILSEQTIKI